MPSRTMVIAAHMDDETLSCGALIQSRISSGGAVFILVLSGRVYDYGRETEVMSISEEFSDFTSAIGVLGVKGSNSFRCMNMREGEPYSIGYYPALQAVEEALQAFRPAEVVIPSQHDLNQDHRHYADVCAIALRPANLQGVQRILAMTAFDSTPHAYNYFIPFGREVLDVKLAAMACYRRESRELPHPRAPQNIEAFHRVIGSKVGQEFAEPYDLLMYRE